MNILVILLVVGVAGAIVAALVRKPSLDVSGLPAAPVEYAPRMQAVATGTIDVTAVRLGIDARGSKWVRSELEAIAKTYGADDAETRARKLREVSIMLRRVRDSWIYGGAANEPLRPREEAFAYFAKHVEDTKSRLTTATPVEADGIEVSLTLVSVIVVARGELMTVTQNPTGEDLRRALESASHRAADEILALEVLWNDTTSHQLAAVFSAAEVHRLDGTTAGKVFCTFCSAPFPAELVSCPQCGGRAPGRESA